jgi:hypothetical protein
MITTVIRALLVGAAPVAAIVATRVYPDAPPQSATHPCVTAFKVSCVRWSTLSGPDGVAVARVQVGCRAWDKAGSKALAEAVRAQLNGYPLKRGDVNIVAGIYVRYVDLVDERDVYHRPVNDDDKPVFETQLDFRCWYRETP